MRTTERSFSGWTDSTRSEERWSRRHLGSQLYGVDRCPVRCSQSWIYPGPCPLSFCVLVLNSPVRGRIVHNDIVSRYTHSEVACPKWDCKKWRRHNNFPDFSLKTFTL